MADAGGDADGGPGLRDYRRRRFVTPGQRAVVKVDSFPYAQFETIEDEVVKVAVDAVRGGAAGQAQADATKPGWREAQGLTLQARPVADLVFVTRLRPAA